MRTYRRWYAFVWILILPFLAGSFLLCGPVAAGSAQTAQGRPAAEQTFRMEAWEYAWETQTAAIGDASSGWSRLPSAGWQTADTLLNPDGRNGSRLLWFRTRLPYGSAAVGSVLLQASQLFEVYLDDGRLIYRQGDLPPGGSPQYIGTPSRIVPLPEDADGRTLYVRVYSHSGDIGFIQQPEVAAESAIQLGYFRSQSLRLFLAGFYMLVGGLALYPFFRLKQVHLLSFAAFSVHFGLYTGTRTALTNVLWDKPEFWMMVELASLMLSIASALAFTEHLFGAGRGNLLRRLWKLHGVYAAASIPLVLLHAVQADHVLRVYQGLILVSMVAGINRIARTAWTGDRDAKTVLLGMTALCLTGAFDILRQIVAVDSRIPELAYGGAFVFLVSLIIVIIRRLLMMLARLTNTEKLSVAGQLAAGVAHEIRNPVTVISGYLQLMKRTESNTRMIDIMQGEINRIRLIMNEFLFLAKPAEPKFADHTLEGILRDVLQLFRIQAKTAGVSIRFRCPSDFPDLSCDDNQLKQVFVNVIKNALEAMPDGGELSITVSKRDGEALIVVTDTGCGIPDKVLARIGEPFYTTKENGNGLGIMICRSIMDNHKGSFVVTSAADVGTTVTIKLPIRKK
ncbi:ATP-binding protein [Gorillibacterium sp. sgz5001074]|uniref:ATP-binding protein n=1 Tax=Gorillibacterium sp. sgz5001074 TaxID=3446695 RepID=UPI003F6796A1